MGKETTAKDSKPLETRTYLDNLTELINDTRCQFIFEIIDIVSKIDDDIEAIKYLEQFKDKLRYESHGLRNIPDIEGPNEKCRKFFINPEIEWRKKRIIGNLNRSKLKQNVINQNDKLNNIDLDSNSEKLIEWKGKSIELLELITALIEAKSVSGKSKDSITNEFAKFFGVEFGSDPSIQLHNVIDKRKLTIPKFLVKLEKAFGNYVERRRRINAN